MEGCDERSAGAKEWVAKWQRKPSNLHAEQQLEAQQKTRRQQRSYGCCFWGWPPEEDGHAEQDRERILQWMLGHAGTTKELRMISHRTREGIVSQLKDTPFTNDAGEQQEIFNAALYRLFEKTTFPV